MKKFNISFHAKILLSGFLRTLGGAGTAAMFALSVYGFVAIPAEGGYVAVCDFIAAVACLFIALAFMYALGVSKEEKKKGRFSA